MTNFPDISVKVKENTLYLNAFKEDETVSLQYGWYMLFIKWDVIQGKKSIYMYV